MTRLVFVVAFATSLSTRAAPCDEVKQLLSTREAAELGDALQVELRSLSSGDLVSAYCRALKENIEEKRRSKVELTAAALVRHALQYERFRIETLISAGVSPKRYFGFFDEEGDTAAYERTMRRTIIDAVAIINDYAQERRLPIRVTEKEIAVTFLAEGGALLLTERQNYLERVHPVRGIGLDSFRDGFAQHSTLIHTLDTHFGTRLGRLSWKVGRWSVLLRPMTFREAVLGTAVMYLYEKHLTADKRAAQSSAALASLPLDRQFVETSLVYNSGIFFSSERVEQMLRCETGRYLLEVNELNRGKRPQLVVPPAEHPAQWLGEHLPQQLTSWNAVYHVMQRYGAWLALARFSDVFDEQGRFVKR
jgi:hypothetical protein